MYANKYDSNGSAQMGADAEETFKSLISKYGGECEKANFYQETREHWDFKVSQSELGAPKRVDVKAMKKLTRTDMEPNDEIVWIEFKNVNGNDGWLYGKADYIAFQVKEGFLMINRKRLARKCERLVGFVKEQIHEGIAGNIKDFYRLISRRNRQDVITIIKKADLLKMKHTLLEYK